MAELHIGRETLEEVRRGQEGLEQLLKRHWHEIAFYPDIPLAVDWAFYEAAEKGGVLRIFTIRDDDKLVGYAVYLVRYAPHYKESLQAVQDVIFLAPEYRKGAIGRGFVAFADQMLKAEGVQVTYQHSKIRSPIDAVLVRERYELVERVWAKRHDRS